MTYHGLRGIPGAEVLNGDSRHALRHVVYHSPDGFEWGYAGSGPSDLALSILADALGERQTDDQAKHHDVSGCPRSFKLHQDFKRQFILRFGPEWAMGMATVKEWVETMEADALEGENMASG